MLFKPFVLALLFSSASWAQSIAPSAAASKPVEIPETVSEALPASPSPVQNSPTASASQQPASAGKDDYYANMRLDLDHMDSLLNNMSSEITFLRDQNLQILLNTNGQLWRILIRDLRLQLAREEQLRARPVPSSASPKAETESPGKSRPK